MLITAVPRSDMDPCPRVQVTVTGIPAGATVTLERSYDGVSAGVRGTPKTPVLGGSIVVTDYEVPPDAAITYACAASTGSSASATAVLRWPFEFWDTVIMQDPLAPDTARAAVLTDKSLASMMIVFGGDVVRPQGSSLPLAIGGAAYAPSEMLLQWYAKNEAEHRDFLPLLSGRPLLVRSLEAVPLPGLAYIRLSAVTVEREGIIRPEWDRMRTYSGYASLVRPPAASVVVPTYTWGDFDVDYEGLTHADLSALWAGKTWLDWQKDPRRA